jgi:hypothetical protein
MNLFYNLPSNILMLIYEYDSTYRKRFKQKVLKQMMKTYLNYNCYLKFYDNYNLNIDEIEKYKHKYLFLIMKNKIKV